jgi:hypothetical protein
MNTAGINNGLTSKFIANDLVSIEHNVPDWVFQLLESCELHHSEISFDKLVFAIEKQFWVSEWYDHLVYDGINTPITEFIWLSEIITDANNQSAAKNQFQVKPESSTTRASEIISKVFGNRAFCRLDSVSPKSGAVHVSDKTILTDLLSSERTAPFVRNIQREDHRVVIRKYIDQIDEDYYELRCFVHGKQLRAISGPGYTNITRRDFARTAPILKNEMRKFVKRIVGAVAYDDFVVDIIVPKCMFEPNVEMYNSAFVVIEINTPVWLFATSGLFDLSIPSHVEILTGTYQPTIIAYPVIRMRLSDTTDIKF